MNNATDSAASSPREARLAQHFVSLADTLVDDYDVVELLERLAHTCVDVLDATAAGVLLIDQRGGLQLVASSSEEMRLLELFQLQADEGPCLDCIATGAPVTVEDLPGASGRWPRFTEAAALVGFHSVHALPLRLRSEVIGGLNLFRGDVPALTAADRQIAQALADVATIGVLQQRSMHRSSLLAEQLQYALDSRVVIEQAKGVLAEHGQVPMDVAYDVLRSYARNNNLKLSSVAEDIVRGKIPLGQMASAKARS